MIEGDAVKRATFARITELTTRTKIEVVAVLLAVGAYVLRARSGGGAAGGAGGSNAVEDPATLVPLVLAAPSPLADDAFASRIMKFVTELKRASKAGSVDDPELSRAEGAVLDDEAKHVLGDRVASVVRGVLLAAKDAARARADDEPSVTALDVAVARLDNALLAGKLPYFVDASVIRSRDRSHRIVLLYEFMVAESSLYDSPRGRPDGAAARVRAVRLRRIDRLNWTQSALGFLNLNRAQAVVLLDPIDEQLARHVLPALAEGADMPLVIAADSRRPRHPRRSESTGSRGAAAPRPCARSRSVRAADERGRVARGLRSAARLAGEAGAAGRGACVLCAP